MTGKAVAALGTVIARTVKSMKPDSIVRRRISRARYGSQYVCTLEQSETLRSQHRDSVKQPELHVETQLEDKVSRCSAILSWLLVASRMSSSPAHNRHTVERRDFAKP